MFDTTKTPMTERLADAADLLIDFATLGEYGLEPVVPPARRCEGRRRRANQRSTGTWAGAIAHFATQP